MLKSILDNHVLATLVLVLVMVMGVVSYQNMPREKNPTFNYNAVSVVTGLPGASAWDIEKVITTPIEAAVAKVSDVRTVTSSSQEGFSSVTVRFGDIDDETYDRRITDLRREIQNASAQLPKEASQTSVNSVNSSNAFPSASVMVYSLANDENLRKQARYVTKDIERIKGIDSARPIGLQEPEFQIRFKMDRLQGLGISPTSLADTVRAYFRNVSAGTIKLNDQQWVVRLIGEINDLEYLSKLPIITARGEIQLDSIAEVTRSRSKASGLVNFRGHPAIMISIAKKGNANTLELLDDINKYIEKRNELSESTGITLSLLYDQTDSIRSSINVMETNAFYGLILVMLMTWLFLGWKMAMLTTIGIPFTIAGTFWVLSTIGFTLNNPVLLAVVISLGMLVDDAIVVVETMYFYLSKGGDAAVEVVKALEEVIGPVTAAVLTTIAAFMPLMLLPGVLGKFMVVVPVVVTVALLFSLIEAFWLLPAHVQSWDVNFDNNSKSHQMRVKMTHTLKNKFSHILIKAMRHPKSVLFALIMSFFISLAAVSTGAVKVNFFAFDSYRVFYIDVETNPGTSLHQMQDKLLFIEKKMRAAAKPNEIRAVATAAGRANNKTGDHLGRILVTLKPQDGSYREIDEFIEAIRPSVTNIQDIYNVNIVTFSDVPKAASIKVRLRGDDFDEIGNAVKGLKKILSTMEAVNEIKVDDNAGSMQLSFTVDIDVARRAGLNPETLSRTVRLLVDGEVVASVQDKGEKVDIRLLNDKLIWRDIDEFMRQTISLPNNGGEIPLAQLLLPSIKQGVGKVQHYKFRRSMTVEAGIDKKILNTLEANNFIKAKWKTVAHLYPNVVLDFTGELDDITESLDALSSLFLFGLLLIFLILGTQFNSYWQPLMILLTVPMAFTGVILGLFVTNNPLSLFTLYGVIALAGIAVNDAIVLISTANNMRKAGRSRIYAAVFASRRRFVPVIITSLTTIAGLFSLSTGLAGYSIMWGPVATAIVWGLMFSTFLTLIVLPILYYTFSKDEYNHKQTVFEKISMKILPTVATVAKVLPGGKDINEKMQSTQQDNKLNKAGLQLIKEGKHWESIAVFEEGVSQSPDNLSLALNAAHAMLIFMQKNGSDEGFLKRTKRYLDKAAP
ncbi:MAG: efflux RND transporter permease subunit, partial [Methylococcales bacterium]|nr:efflux RND transporter permease subunit [Methylococcales bacterium]